MAFFQLVLHANQLEKVRKAYEDEKLTSIDIWKSGEHRFTIKQRIRRRKLWLDLIYDNNFYFISIVIIFEKSKQD